MKKGIIGIIALIALSFSASSCCKTCTHTDPAYPETQICEKNYNSTADYNTAVSAFEANGYTCK